MKFLAVGIRLEGLVADDNGVEEDLVTSEGESFDALDAGNAKLVGAFPSVGDFEDSAGEELIDSDSAVLGYVEASGAKLIMWDEKPYLPPFSLRFRFSDPNFDPTTLPSPDLARESRWVKRGEYSENVWDWTHTPPTPFDQALKGNWWSMFAHQFQDPGNLVDVLAGNTREVHNMYGLFQSCTSLRSIELFATSKVTDASRMFYGCSLLRNIPQFDWSGCTDMRYYCNRCTLLEQAPPIDAPLCTNIGNAFALCTNLESVSAINMASVADARSLYEDCTRLKRAQLLSTGNLKNADSMFKSCHSLESIPTMDTSKLENVTRMFENCYSVNGGALAMYTQLSAQANPPESYYDAFYLCGRDTEIGQVELAQIPQDWGGTA